MATAQSTIAQPAPTLTPRRERSTLLGYLLITPPVLIMLALIFYPAAQAIIDTLFIPNPQTGQAAFTLQGYISFFQNANQVSNLRFTILETLWTVALLFVVGFPLALYLRFSQSRMAAVVQVLTLFPLFVPGVILAFAFIQFLTTHGMFDTLLNAVGIYSLLNMVGIRGFTTPYLQPQGIVMALVWEGIPFTVLVLTAGLRQVENSVVESARDVGANGLQIFWNILLPLSLRSVVIVFCLNVIGVFGAFTIPYLLGGAAPMMMGVSMQETFGSFQDRIGALTQAVITFMFCAVVGVLYIRTVSRRREGV